MQETTTGEHNIAVLYTAETVKSTDILVSHFWYFLRPSFYRLTLMLHLTRSCSPIVSVSQLASEKYNE